MESRASGDRLAARAATRVLLAFVLAASLAPTVPARAVANEGTLECAPIEDLLVAGNYAEGEAVAIVRANAQPHVAAQTEDLAEVEANSVELAVGNAERTDSMLDDAVALRAQDAGSDACTVQLVVDHSRTTEQILRDLYDDPNVIAAEPNYSYDAAEALEGYGYGASSAEAFVAASAGQLSTQAASMACTWRASSHQLGTAGAHRASRTALRSSA